MKCGQNTCDNGADYRFTWPGHDEAGICASCLPKLVNVANAMGLHLQILPLDAPTLAVRDAIEGFARGES